MTPNRGLKSFDNTPQEYSNTAQEGLRKTAELTRLASETGRVLAENARNAAQTVAFNRLAVSQAQADLLTQRNLTVLYPS